MRAAIMAIAAGLLVRPEVGSYQAERRLRAATTALRTAVALPSGPERVRLLANVDAEAAAVAGAQRGDSRALMLAGSARLLAHDANGAFSRYRAALARGERAEILLGLARTHLLAGDLIAAQTDLLRAAWVSPALVRALPGGAARALLREVKLLGRALRNGEIVAPPPLAPADAPDAARPRKAERPDGTLTRTAAVRY